MAIIAVLALAGCSDEVVQRAEAGAFAPRPDRLDAITYRAVDEMLAAAPMLARAGGPVVVTSIADIGDIDRSTPFGNIVSDMVRTRLVQRGVAVTEMRLRASVLLQRTGGEFMLGRDRRALLAAPAAADVVTGTYAVGESAVYVSLKIVEAGDAHIVAAADFVAPLSWNVAHLLTREVGSGR
jgi:TolB-like protein